jgi:hypothetical protein
MKKIKKKPSASAAAVAANSMLILKPSESRRKFLRIPVAHHQNVKVSIAAASAGRKTYECLDLSVYGVSFRASKEETGRFAEGKSLDAVSFKIDGRLVVVGARVARVTPAEDGEGNQVALEFTEAQSEDIFFLSKLVADVAGARPIQVALPAMSGAKRVGATAKTGKKKIAGAKTGKKKKAGRKTR